MAQQPPGGAALSDGTTAILPSGNADVGLLAEITARHGKSNQPESKQVMAVLQALTEVIKAQDLPVTPASLFAACMSAMERSETLNSSQVTLAMCSLLGLTLPCLPNSILRAKFTGSTQVLGSVLKRYRDQAPVARAALHCLSQVLSALDPNKWQAALVPFELLMSFVTDTKPKVRKRAQAGLSEVMAALQNTPALAPASEAVLKLCQAVLPGPEAAARAAAAASNKNRSAAEAAIAQAVSDALHLIGALKSGLPLLTGQASKTVSELLLKLYALRQPLLSRHATEALGALCGSRASHLPAQALAELLAVLADGEGTLWERNDADTAASFARLLDAGMSRLHDLDPQLCAQRLPRAVHALVAQLSAEQDGARFGASQALRGIVRSCVDAPLVAAAATTAAESAAGQRPLQSVVAAIAGSLTPRYEEAWGLALPVVSDLLEQLGACGADGAALARSLILQLGQLLAGAAEADEEEVEAAGGAADAAMSGARPAGAGSLHATAAEAALGTALRALGPEVVLHILPLNLKEGIDGTAEPRTWLLPLLRKHVRGTSLSYWTRHLMPLAKALGARAARAGQSQLGQSCLVLELQLWACLPAFASYASDLATAYPAVVKDLGAAFSNRPDLRLSICTALQRMASQAVRTLRAAGRTDLLGSAAATAAAAAVATQAARAVRAAKASTCSDSDYDEDDDGMTGGGGEMGSDDGSDADVDGGAGADDLEVLGVPAAYDEGAAIGALGALRQFSRNWLPLLFKTFLESPGEQRDALAGTISAYALVTDSTVLAGFFRTVLLKLVKVVEDAASEAPVRDPVLEGGSTPAERRGSFLDLALCLAPGLDDAGLSALFKAAKPCLVDDEASVQKKGYKVLSYLCNSRPTFLRTHVQDILEQVMAGTASSLSASKRHRLRCFKPLILLLDSPGCPPVTMPEGGDEDGEGAASSTAMAAAAGGAADGVSQGPQGTAAASGTGPAGRAPADGVPPQDVLRSHLVAGLVGEIVLCTKEVNKKTRAAAYGLLIQIARRMDETHPAPLSGLRNWDAGEASMDTTEAPAVLNKGGLHRLFTMVMAGLVGTTPHMVSAAVMALARLLYEFAPQLEGVVPELLPAVLMLLRTKSRETVKSVLGFVKVCAMRMPVDVLLPQLGPILEGLLLWSDDSKNKFKLKVRVIVERLARRCGHEALAKVIPPGEVRLLTHIRKQTNRKERRRAKGGSQADGGSVAEDVRSRRSGSAGSALGARTARASEWAHSRVFSDEEEQAGAQSEHGARSVRGGARGQGAHSAAGGSARGGPASGSGRLREGSGGDPMDLLDAGAARQLVKTAAGVRRQRPAVEGMGDDFKRGENGKMVVEEEDPFAWLNRKKRKHRAEDGYNSEDSDFEDMKSYGGMSHAFKSHAQSVKFAGSALGDLSLSGKSARSKAGSQAGSRGGATSQAGSRSGRSSAGGKSQHSGDRYKPKGKTTGGDVKPGGSKVEPYAYWKFDRKMLNRRKGKQADAHKSLTGVVGGARAGALRGAKAKRMAAGGSKRRRVDASGMATDSGRAGGGGSVAGGSSAMEF